MSLFVTFYGDGPYWDNALRLPAYPSDYAYFRPFRYRDKWIHPDLLAKIDTKPAAFNGEPAILAMRFEAARDRLIPIRGARLSSIEREDDVFVYFRFGRFFEFPDPKAGTLESFSIPMPPEGISGTDDYLFFEASASLPNTSASDAETHMWARLGELIDAEKRLPVAPEAKHGVFFHFRTPTTNTVAPVEEIGTSYTSGAKFGASLRERASHELVVLHRIPHLIGSRGSIEPVGATVEAKNFEVAPEHLSISGNYGRHVLTVTGLRASAAWEEIVIKPEIATVTTKTGESIRLLPLNIPLRATRNWKYRLRRRWIPLVIIALAIGTQGLLGGWDLIKDNWRWAIPVVLAAILGSDAVLRIRE
jgi:hypothetical protein